LLSLFNDSFQEQQIEYQAIEVTELKVFEHEVSKAGERNHVKRPVERCMMQMVGNVNNKKKRITGDSINSIIINVYVRWREYSIKRKCGS